MSVTTTRLNGLAILLKDTAAELEDMELFDAAQLAEDAVWEITAWLENNKPEEGERIERGE